MSPSDRTLAANLRAISDENRRLRAGVEALGAKAGAHDEMGDAWIRLSDLRDLLDGGDGDA